MKEAIIIPLPTPNKDSNIISNYRPISKLSCLVKVFEKLQAIKIEKNVRNYIQILVYNLVIRTGLTTCHALKIAWEIATYIENSIQTPYYTKEVIYNPLG